jgi:hypothetical protein
MDYGQYPEAATPCKGSALLQGESNELSRLKLGLLASIAVHCNGRQPEPHTRQTVAGMTRENCSLVSVILLLVTPMTDSVPQKVQQSGKSKRRIDVVFDDIEGKIVESAESPHAKNQQPDSCCCRILQHQQSRSDKTQQQKQPTLDPDQSGVGDIRHVVAPSS